VVMTTSSGSDRGETATVAAAAPESPDFARLLTLVERNVTARFGDALKAGGATVDEWRILSFLEGGTGRAMTEIAEFAMLPAPSLTKVVDRMTAANLVYRRVDSADRRRVLVIASAHGRQVLRRWDAAVERTWDELVTGIGAEEIALLRALLTRAAARLG
jgi:DNA-binding MarR family transcriptional regulator